MNLPIYLILFRFLLAPVILGLAYFKGHDANLIIVILMFLGLISDILDGIIARNQGTSSTKLRRLDSQVDMVFWVSIGVASWILVPSVIMENIIGIRILLIMEVSCYVISLVKFRRETCTHALLSKLWGVSMLVAFTSLIGFGHAGIPFYFSIFLGLVSHIDRMLITLILPAWHHDVPSAYHAYLIRKGVSFKRNKYLNG